MSDAANFDDDEAFGSDWEEEFSDRLESLLLSVNVSNIAFDEDPDTQLDGIDSIVEQAEAEIDIKTERAKHRNSPNLPIEVWSMKEREKLGWFYTSESDYIVWLRESEGGTNLHTGFVMVLDNELREWFHERRESYRQVDVQNENWTTVVRLVPIDDFPADKLFEFDPTVHEPVKDSQQELSRWSQ